MFSPSPPYLTEQLRIAIVINTSWNIFNYRKGIIKALLKDGHEVLAIAPRDEYSSKLEELGCKFVDIKMQNRGVNPLQDVKLLFDFLSVYKKYKPDFVLHYTIKPNTYGSLACGILKIPCISNVSGLGTVFIRKGWLLGVVKVLYRFAFLIPRRVFFQNNDDRTLFTDLGILKEEKTGLLPGSGIDLSCFDPVPYTRHTPFRFLLIARLLRDKGVLEYAGATAILKEKGYEFESRLVGFFDRESKFNITREELENWQEKKLINFLGSSDNIAEQINEADCVVLPSYREGTPRSLLEGMALCKPVIATDVPGCREVLKEGENGYFCLARSAESLALAMEKMMTLSEKGLKEMGESGRKIARARFDERIVVESYLNEIHGKKRS